METLIFFVAEGLRVHRCPEVEELLSLAGDDKKGRQVVVPPRASSPEGAVHDAAVFDGDASGTVERAWLEDQGPWRQRLLCGFGVVLRPVVYSAAPHAANFVVDKLDAEVAEDLAVACFEVDLLHGICLSPFFRDAPNR